MQAKTITYQNNELKIIPQLTEGNKVYLLTKNLKKKEKKTTNMRRN